MDKEMTQDELNEKIRARFKDLPKVVQSAITSADVQKQLRELADTNKLHLDQWQLLENEVMLTLLGFQTPEELPANLKDDLDISDERAHELANEISKIVFAPVRAQLERELDTPSGNARVASAGEIAVAEKIATPVAQVPVSPAVPVVPATPPAPAPTTQAVRAPISEAYKAGEPSTVRKAVEDDPYRESPQ